MKKYYEKAKVVILQGPTLRKGKGKVQENDFVIVDYERKVIICIESKATLNGTTGQKAVKQMLELKKLLEEYFASELASGEWAFVGMIFTNNSKKSICQTCTPFVIQGCSEVAAKLALIEDHLKPIRKQCSPNHTEYASLLRGLVFVVLAQPISTHCTIVGDVVDKVVGKETAGKTKAKAGQGDFQSIIFWTNEQAKIMLTVLQFVFFISPWSTGKTLLMRES